MIMTDRARLFPAALVLLLAAGCSSKHGPAFPDEAKASAESPDTMSASPAKESTPPGTIARASVDQALLRGPAWMLNKIQTEEVLRQNKFIGWRLVSFPATWDSSGLQPGDVVTDVNGMSLEHPEQFFEAWSKVAEANEIRIAYERNGTPAVTVLKILGAPRPETKKALEMGAMTPPSQADGQGPRPRNAVEAEGKKKFQTKVIGGDGDPIETSEY